MATPDQQGRAVLAKQQLDAATENLARAKASKNDRRVTAAQTDLDAATELFGSAVADALKEEGQTKAKLAKALGLKAADLP